MEKIPKLTYTERNGAHGETIQELDAESQKAWSEYMAKINMARLALKNNTPE